jgi:hypothetical protein
MKLNNLLLRMDSKFAKKNQSKSLRRKKDSFLLRKYLMSSKNLTERLSSKKCTSLLLLKFLLESLSTKSPSEQVLIKVSYRLK